MSNVKFYSSKSNAKRAAKAAGINLDTAKLLEEEGQFAYVAGDDENLDVSDNDQRYINICGFSHCPGCNIHLSNGLLDFGTLQEMHGKDAIKHQQHEWSCMGCGHEWGEEITVAAPVAAPVAAKPAKPAVETGIKIEKDREERNGVTRPSAGGVCRAIWDACEAKTVDGKAPSLKDMKAHATAQGWSHVTTGVQYYLYRRFMGIRGRQ